LLECFDRQKHIHRHKSLCKQSVTPGIIINLSHCCPIND
jgi:hypothetical protein